MEHLPLPHNLRPGVLSAVFLVLVCCAVQACSSAPERLWTYPAPGQGEYRSEQYRVTLEQGRRRTSVFCYRMRSIWHYEFPGEWAAQWFPKENHWVTFSFSGKVAVIVEPIRVHAEAVEVRPAVPGVSASVHDGRVRIDIERPGQYYIMVKARGVERQDFDHPLFLFANPPETNVPRKGEKGVHYFGPGVHDIGFQYRVKGGETVYIAGGALVRGSIFYEGDNVRIHGRGILSDRKLMLRRVQSAIAEKAAGKTDAWQLNHDAMYRDKWATIYGETDADNALIEGITIIESPFYMVRTHGAGTVFRNLKLLGDLYNNNGIVAGPNHKILDCFLKVEDDVFCWMAPVSETRNCVIWKQDNGSLVMMGYGYSYETHGHVMRDNWIVRDVTNTEVMARGLFGLASSAGTMFTDCLIENLTVYGDILCLLAIDNRWRPTPWSVAPQGQVKLRPIKLHFRNVEIRGTEKGTYWGPYVADLVGQPMRSRLRTEAEGSIHIVLENVRINGKRLKSDADWPNGLLREGNVTVEYR